MQKTSTYLLALLIFTQPLLGNHSPIPKNCKQLIIGITENWNSSQTTLQLYEKSRNGKWHKALAPIPARIGRKGLAWGKGLHPMPNTKRLKKEGDKRSPAGLFYIGGVWGYNPKTQLKVNLPYQQITPRNLWVEDPKSKYYNQHLILPHNPKTHWQKKQQMRQNDHAHSLKIFIAHNPPPQAKPGAGSAIFFHIWRKKGQKPTVGCTAMRESDLRILIAKLHPKKTPCYLLLPKAEYHKLSPTWQLP